MLARNLALFARSVPKYVSSKKRQMTPPGPKKLVLTDTRDNYEACKLKGDAYALPDPRRRVDRPLCLYHAIPKFFPCNLEEPSMSRILAIETELYRVPLDEPLEDAIHGTHTHFELIVCTVHTEDGLTGTGYTYTGGFGGTAIRSLILTDLAPFLIGKDADCIKALWNTLNWRVHYVGKGGLVSFAVAALDTALWDIRGKKAGLPLWKLAGGSGRTVKAYGGGIDLHFTIERLLNNIQGYLDAGLRGIKIKVGKEQLDEDVERVAAVRKFIGNDIDLMVDANMKWTVAESIRATHRFREFNVLWLEEPTIPDDLRGYAEIAARGALPLAAGENYHTVMEFKNMFEFSRVNFPEPNISTVSSITA